jgi:cyanophycinase-like exopeptidase
MMTAGYERGFAFLPGTAIDQHFSQRQRFADMTHVKAAHRQLLGIGLDEATAIIVQGHVAEVVGTNKVHFFDRSQPVVEGTADYTSVAAGQKYDLTERRVSAEP